MTVKRTFIHLNGNQICSLDVETTGLDPEVHELVQIAIVPLTATLDPLPGVTPLDILIRPNRPDMAEDGAIRAIGGQRWLDILEHGIPADKAFDIVCNWIERLELPQGKKIAPLAHNWVFDRAFLLRWFGTQLFEEYFFHQYRCSMALASSINDIADFDTSSIPFPHTIRLSAVAKRLGLDVDDGSLHDAYYDARITAMVYKKIIENFSLNKRLPTL